MFAPGLGLAKSLEQVILLRTRPISGWVFLAGLMPSGLLRLPQFSEPGDVQRGYCANPEQKGEGALSGKSVEDCLTGAAELVPRVGEGIFDPSRSMLGAAAFAVSPGLPSVQSPV